MAILDSKGRLFGKVSLIDLGAAVIILAVVLAVFFFPGTSGSVAQLGQDIQPIEVDLMVRGLSVREPDTLLEAIATSESTNIIIRNQPYGEVGVKEITPLPRTVAVPQPDGSVEALPDPRPELNLTTDMLITLADEAQITEDGPVFGNNKVKIGTPIEIEGQTYRFNTVVVGVRILEE